MSAKAASPSLPIAMSQGYGERIDGVFVSDLSRVSDR
jgi:hypothetical protein